MQHDLPLKRLRAAAVALAAALTLAGCGGGGSASGSAMLGEDATPTDTTTVAAADLTLTTAAASVRNSGTDTVTVTATAVDKNRNAVANIPVTLAVDNGATVQVSGAKTDANGKVTGVVSVGADKANRPVVVTATSGSLTRTLTLMVTGSKLVATALPQALTPGQAGQVQFSLRDANDLPIAGQAIVITGVDGVQSTGLTGVNGDYTYSYTAPATGGAQTVRASAAGVETVADVTVVVSGGGQAIPAATLAVQSSSLAATPSVLPVNAAGSTTNRTQLRALFLSANNQPVKNVRAVFDLDGDKQSIGGSFSSGTTAVFSDANGVARADYIAGIRASAKDGVTVRVCWDYADFTHVAGAAAGTAGCPHAEIATLTVATDALSVAVGTNGSISSQSLTYTKQFVVQVVDAAGVAARDVQVSASVDLPKYQKGYYTRGVTSWVRNELASCDNEDVNRNGVAEVFKRDAQGNPLLDANGSFWGEDANASFDALTGQPALDPQKGLVALSFEGASKTDAAGQVVINLVYPQNAGSWLTFNLTVSAAGVAGTEGRANFQALLPVPAEVLRNVSADPAFRESPFGIETSGVVSVSEPGNSRAAAMLCTNKR